MLSPSRHKHDIEQLAFSTKMKLEVYSHFSFQVTKTPTKSSNIFIMKQK